MVKINAVGRIRLNGHRFAPGDTIDNIDDNQARQLIESGAAVFYDENDRKTDLDKSNLTLDTVVENNVEISEKRNEEDFLVIKESFTLEELKEDAARFGMKFSSNVKKKELLTQIFEERKEKQFLDLLEDGED